MRKKIPFLYVGTLMSLISFANPANLTIKLNGYNPERHKNFVDIKIPSVNDPFSEQIKISVASLQ